MKLIRKVILEELTLQKNINYHWSNNYKFYKIFNDEGIKKSVGQHRLLALAFIPTDKNTDDLEINHINSNRGDNLLSNLEWVTRSSNYQHAIDAGKAFSIRTKVVNLKTNEVRYFKSFKELKRNLNLVFNYPKTKVFHIGDYEIEILNFEEVKERLHTKPKRIVARDIFTNKLYISDTPNELSRFINVHPKVIRRQLNKNLHEYPINGFDLKYYEKNIKWYKYSEEELEAFKGIYFITNPVYLVTENGDRKLFGSVKKASKYTGIHERSVRESLYTGRKIQGFLFERHVKI